MFARISLRNLLEMATHLRLLSLNIFSIKIKFIHWDFPIQYNRRRCEFYACNDSNRLRVWRFMNYAVVPFIGLMPGCILGIMLIQTNMKLSLLEYLAYIVGMNMAVCSFIGDNLLASNRDIFCKVFNYLMMLEREMQQGMRNLK